MLCSWHHTAIARSIFSGSGVLCVATKNRAYVVNFKMYGDEVMAVFSHGEVKSSIYQFSSVKEFKKNLEDELETFDKKLLLEGEFEFPASSIVVQDKINLKEWAIVDMKRNVVEEIFRFEANSLEEAKAFHEKHREVVNR